LGGNLTSGGRHNHNRCSDGSRQPGDARTGAGTAVPGGAGAGTSIDWHVGWHDSHLADFNDIVLDVAFPGWGGDRDGLGPRIAMLVSICMIPLPISLCRKHCGIEMRGTYRVAGVTVTSMKLEQSASLEARSVLSDLVPVTARAQLSALQALLSAPWAAVRPRRSESWTFITTVEGVFFFYFE
jgi:hypothetical protein